MTDEFEQIKKDIRSKLLEAASKLGDYSYDFINSSYAGECMTSWPLRGKDGKEILDPKTEESFGEFNPESLAKLLRKEVLSEGDMVKATVWIDILSSKDPEKMERAGRIIEAFGHRPWTRLKQMLSDSRKINEIIK